MKFFCGNFRGCGGARGEESSWFLVSEKLKTAKYANTLKKRSETPRVVSYIRAQIVISVGFLNPSVNVSHQLFDCFNRLGFIVQDLKPELILDRDRQVYSQGSVMSKSSINRDAGEYWSGVTASCSWIIRAVLAATSRFGSG